MFYQGRECVDLVLKQTVPGWTPALIVLDLGLKDDEKAWLNSVGATLASNIQIIPNFPDAPGYMRAMTCRPYLRDLLPGYDIYLWMDADIRMVAPDALRAYVFDRRRPPQRHRNLPGNGSHLRICAPAPNIPATTMCPNASEWPASITRRLPK